ncbi:MAG: hypothetical protein ABWY78_23360 [Microvirga sp.]
MGKSARARIGQSSDWLAFVLGKAAIDAADRVVYDPSTGRLWFDKDGSGPAAAMQIAKLKAGITLSYKDFLICKSIVRKSVRGHRASNEAQAPVKASDYFQTMDSFSVRG